MSIPSMTTDRLLLRPFTDDDVDRVTALLQSPEISATTLDIHHPYTREDAALWIGTHTREAEAGKLLTWAICRKDDGLLMGAFGIHLHGVHPRASIGYWLGIPYWNRGYTTEAARAVVAFGFDDLGLQRIEASCLFANTASARVLEKAGLVYEGTLRGYYRKHNRPIDADMYGRVRE